MKILFICTHNRCRSILAEAVARHLGAGLIEAASAGSDPAGQVHPMTLEALQQSGLETDGLTSKSWDDVKSFQPDVVITVCDRAAGEQCPLWAGDIPKVHWGLADPSTLSGSRGEQMAAFQRTIAVLSHRLQNVTEVLKEKIPEAELWILLHKLGNPEGV